MNKSVNRSWSCDPGPSLVQQHCDPWLSWLRHCSWCPKGWRASLQSPARQPGSHSSSRSQRRCGHVRAQLYLCATEVTLPVAPVPSLKAAPSDSICVTPWVRCPVMPRNLVQVQIVIHFYINKKLTRC
ncbi:hypothetical protein Nmel_001205 [Mimus melanotis]